MHLSVAEHLGDRLIVTRFSSEGSLPSAVAIERTEVPIPAIAVVQLVGSHHVASDSALTLSSAGSADGSRLAPGGVHCPVAVAAVVGSDHCAVNILILQVELVRMCE